MIIQEKWYSLPQLIVQRSEQTPHQIAFQRKNHDHWEKVSYLDFYQELESLCFGLHEMGARSGQRWIFISKNSYTQTLMECALICLGITPFPISTESTQSSIVSLWERIGPDGFVFDDSDILRKLGPIVSESVFKVDLSNSSRGDLSQIREKGLFLKKRKPQFIKEMIETIAIDQALCVLFTPGTTRESQGVVLTHRNLLSVLHDACLVLKGHLQPNEEDLLSVLPHSTVWSKLELVGVFFLGWKMSFVSDLDQLHMDLSATSPTIIFTHLRFLNALMDRIQSENGSLIEQTLGEADTVLDRAKKVVLRPILARKIQTYLGGRLKFMVVGGGSLGQEGRRLLEESGILALEAYGMTETSGCIALNTPDALKPGSVGRPLPEVSIRISQEGEIQIRSTKNFMRYFDSLQATEEIYPDDWLRTGDAGYLDSDGFLFVTGRRQERIRTTSGQWVYPDQIESQVLSHPNAKPWLKNIAVMGEGRPYLVALVCLCEEEIIRFAHRENVLFSQYSDLIRHPRILKGAQDILDKINQDLPPEHRVQRFTLLPHGFSISGGELTPTFTLRRKHIQERYASYIEALYA